MMGTLAGLIQARNTGGMDLDTLRARAVSDMRGHVDMLIGADLEHDERLGPIDDRNNGCRPCRCSEWNCQERATFKSSAEDSHYVLEFSLGAGIGSASSALTSGPMDRYAAIWEKKSGTAMGCPASDDIRGVSGGVQQIHRPGVSAGSRVRLQPRGDPCSSQPYGKSRQVRFGWRDTT